ncbi:MAG TPA: 30S ribosomal protein S20 [Anaerohalosphaeraceae bacterium]|nr:30S ribosomal protein S20 [Anaerohalosphaeraceae bacterium]HRT50661.1 30S ribosomal protein S20 [Anaerohalosphaeraceae bacterium]HRT86643.1 30S ribosomal protein S20 [Anaerohalosphaeraceae bacterium]
MAHSLSAKKRVRQAAKRRVINRARKSMVKTQTKRFDNALTEGNIEKAKEEYRLLVKRLDKVASTSTMHKNTVSRLKSRMARRLNRAAAKKA